MSANEHNSTAGLEGIQPQPVDKGKYVLIAGWNDAPHLKDSVKEELARGIPPNLRRARMEGIPYLGSGLIYAQYVTVESITIDPIPLPDHWLRSFGLDVGWNRTAAIWSAWDRASDIVYLYSEHYMSQAEPVIHASAIKGSETQYNGKMGVYRAPYIPGVIDPAANGRSQIDGKRLVELYKGFGLDLEFADNSVDAGITEMWNRLSTGRLKVFNTLVNWLTEYKLYRRDEKGKIVKSGDHLMDATRYDVMSGLARAIPVRKLQHEFGNSENQFAGMSRQFGGGSWMGM